MPQKQCPWCGKVGDRYREDDPLPRPKPHDDGSDCVCRHVTTGSRAAAIRDGGRYYHPERGWVCPWCGTDAPASEEELDRAAEEEREEFA